MTYSLIRVSSYSTPCILCYTAAREPNFCSTSPRFADPFVFYSPTVVPVPPGFLHPNLSHRVQGYCVRRKKSFTPHAHSLCDRPPSASVVFLFIFCSSFPSFFASRAAPFVLLSLTLPRRAIISSRQIIQSLCYKLVIIAMYTYVGMPIYYSGDRVYSYDFPSYTASYHPAAEMQMPIRPSALGTSELHQHHQQQPVIDHSQFTQPHQHHQPRSSRQTSTAMSYAHSEDEMAQLQKLSAEFQPEVTVSSLLSPHRSCHRTSFGPVN